VSEPAVGLPGQPAVGLPGPPGRVSRGGGRAACFPLRGCRSLVLTGW